MAERTSMQLDRHHFLLVVFGNLLLAMASGWFLLPAHVISGGVNGIAVILEKLLLFPPLPVINFTIILCFILGAIFLGRDFAVKTIMSTLLYPLFLQLISIVQIPIFPQVIASLIGGCLTGFGIGLIMRSGGSSGGMDVPPLILNKYFNLSISAMVCLCDSLIVLGGLIVYGLIPVLIGLLSVAVCSRTLHYSLNSKY